MSSRLVKPQSRLTHDGGGASENEKTPAIVLSLLTLFIVDSTVLYLLANQLEVVRIIVIAIINGLAGIWLQGISDQTDNSLTGAAAVQEGCNMVPAAGDR